MSETVDVHDSRIAAADVLPCGGLRYLRREEALLSRAEAEYGLERLWERVAGDAEWEGEPVLTIPAVDETSVRAMFALPPGALPWTPLKDVLPSDVDLGLDTDRLPTLCRVSSVPPVFDHKSPHLPIDLVAATFLMLSRWEEVRPGAPKDEWGNDSHETSLAWRQGFLERPVVDEWALVLRAWLSVKSPGWRAEPSPWRILVTHDVDRIRCARSPTELLRVAAREGRQRGSVPAAVSMLLRHARAPFDYRADPEFRALHDLIEFDETLEVAGLYFFMASTPGPFTQGYDLAAPYAQEVAQEILSREGRIGIHPGYAAAENCELFLEEVHRCGAAIGRPIRTARMHYLRWRHDETAEMMAEAGIEEDYTLGYNTHTGFRCGTSHPFPLWSFGAEAPLPVTEYPLIIQDASMVTCMQLTEDEIQERLELYLARTKAVSGVLTLLLHNVVHYLRTCNLSRTAGTLRRAMEACPSPNAPEHAIRGRTPARAQSTREME